MQNKIDLVKESQAREQYDQIVKFVQGKPETTVYHYQPLNVLLLLAQFIAESKALINRLSVFPKIDFEFETCILLAFVVEEVL